ncbi:MAG TPA: response regulator, partial [Candidatus Paceibacterota bacterium]|nr:response regulator [Candidatus Paceibacterota bacterium]
LPKIRRCSRSTTNSWTLVSLPATQASKIRILVVDDEDSITRMLKLNLEQTQFFEVRTESRGEAALRAAQEFHPRLIILDIMMPDLGGDEVAAVLRNHPLTRNVKIIFLTALAQPNHPYSGPDCVLAKPVDLEAVLRCIHSQLG